MNSQQEITTMTINESLALTPHMGDHLRDAYWNNEWPTLTPRAAGWLFAAGFVIAAAFVAVA
jgi:hypothetical protein